MQNKDHRKDGRFELYYSEGHACLVVYPPKEDGLPVYPEEVVSRMKLLQIPRVRIQKLIEIINEASSLPVKLVEWPEGVLLSSRLTLNISDDKLTVEAQISHPRPGGGELSLAEVHSELKQSGITYGVDEKMIGRVLSERQYGTIFVIASGRRAVQGRESRIQFNFETERQKPFMELKYGRINLKELNFIQNCNPGDVLAELKPAEPAVDGYDVFGNLYPAEMNGEPAELKCGANARIEGDKVLSVIQGNVILNGDVVEVEEVVVVNNVDYETGNIDFDGSVEVKGTIADGFTVKASGDIEVGKCIGRCHVQAGRNVVLKAGINGDREGRIQCGGNLLAKYLESCSISSSADVLVEEAVMNSQVDAEGSLFLTGKRAELIGGFAVVGKVLLCKKIGNMYDARTGIIIGVSPEIIEEFFELKKTLDTCRERLDKLDEQKMQLKVLRPADREGAAKILKALEQVEVDISHTSSDISRRVGEMQKLRETIIPYDKSYILAEERIFKGTRISFGLQDHHVPEKGISSSYIYRKGKIIVETGFNRVKPELPEELIED